MRTYFGEKGDAPVYDNGVQIPIEDVLDLPCYWCGVHIDEDATGFLQPMLNGSLDNGVWEYKPVHRWCDMRQVIGSLAHQRGECFCVTGSHDQERAYEEELGLRTEAEMACKEFFLNTKGIHGRELTGNSSESTSGD